MNTTKMVELNCPCCGEKINIDIKENGNFEVIVPFVISNNNDNSLKLEYEFGELNKNGGENIE